MAALLVVASCSDKGDLYISESEAEKAEVLLPVSVSTSSRTALTDDGETVRWIVGDEVALWAVGATDGGTKLSGERFTLRYFDTTNTIAQFGAAIDPMSTDQEYIYSSFYPYPTSVSGTNLTYTIPTTQSGDYDGVADFRVADESTGSALVGEADQSSARLSFRPLMHVLRITIPEGYNELKQDIASLVVTLPESAAGVMSLDMSNTKATPAFVSGRSSSITVDLVDRTINAGDGQYVWVFINPMSGVTGDLSISAVGADGIRSFDYDIPLVNHTFSAGGITPVNTAIGEAKQITTLTINIENNYIGESLTNLNFTAPTGAMFLSDPDDSSSKVSTISVDANDANKYQVHFITDTYLSTFKGGSLAVEYESENTLVPVSFALSNIVENIENNFYDDVPYLLYQDFSGLNSTISNYDNEDLEYHITTHYNTSGNAVDLSNYGLDSGWKAYRVGTSKGVSLRICCREEASVTYKGYLTTPTFSYIKDGKTVDVAFSYNYSGGETEWIKITAEGSWAEVKWGNYGDPRFTVSANSTTYSQGTSGSYTSITQSHSFTLSSSTNATSFTWTTGVEKDGSVVSSQNGNYWLYLDNIKAYIK